MKINLFPAQNIFRSILNLGILLLFLSNLNIQTVAAQEEDWSPPATIPGLGDEARNPILVADQNRTVHMFTSGWVGDDNPKWGIFYTKWHPDTGWTIPVDILLPSRGQARVKGAFLDQNDIMHLVFFGGDEAGADLYYARVPALYADQVRSWSVPIVVADRPLIPDEAVIGGDGTGNLFILFSGYSKGNGVYSMYSTDGGDSWSIPEIVFLTNDQQLWPSPLISYVDEKGKAFAAWGLTNVSGNSLAVYFSKQNPDSTKWIEPIELATAVGFEADTPAIIKHQSELFVIFHNDNVLWMRRSKDDGLTWTGAVRLFPHVGSNGAASLVVDSGSNLHMFWGQRLPSESATHGVWHSVWQVDSWSFPQALVSGPRSDDFDPSYVNAVISQGYNILVTWGNDPGVLQTGVWYAYLASNTPSLPLRTLSAPTSVPESTPSPSSSQDQIIEDSSTSSTLNPQNPGSGQGIIPSHPFMPVVIAVLPIIILLVGIVIFKSQRR